MSTVKQQAIRAFRDMMRGKENVRIKQCASLGDGSGTVRDTIRKDRVWVRMHGTTEAAFLVLSLSGVEDIEDTPVWLRPTEDGLDWEVYEVDYGMLTNVGNGWGGVTRSMPSHAPTHQWPDGNQGSDPVNVYPRSLAMLRTFRKDGVSLTVRVSPLRYTYGGAMVEFTGSEMMLYTYQPAAGQARYVVTYLDPIGNVMRAHPGLPTVDSGAIVPALPTLPDFAVPSALVRLSGTKTYLSEPDFVDYRLLLDPVVAQGSGGHTIQDEGSSLIPRAKLNFTGAGVTASDDAGNNATVVNVPGITGLANPTAVVGLTAVNGAATTAIRSDGAPALNPADAFQRSWFYV